MYRSQILSVSLCTSTHTQTKLKQLNYHYLLDKPGAGSCSPWRYSTCPRGTAEPGWWQSSGHRWDHWGPLSLGRWSWENCPRLETIRVLSSSPPQIRDYWVTFQAACPPAQQWVAGLSGKRQWPSWVPCWSPPRRRAGGQASLGSWFGWGCASSEWLPASADSSEWHKFRICSLLHSCFSVNSQALEACQKLKLIIVGPKEAKKRGKTAYSVKAVQKDKKGEEKKPSSLICSPLTEVL